jgi:phosphatidylglycerol---prolipoprotein diacylglyceryl transferase
LGAINPVAFRIFNFEIRWYGILIAIALIVGIVVAYYIAKYRQQKADEVINFAPFAVIAGVLGARFLHVIVNWSYYSAHPSYILAFRNGGLAIQGVMLGGILALIGFCKVRKLDFWLWADIMTPALLLGQAIGRWGNYFNQEAFGRPTSLPWGIFIDPANRPAAYASFQYFHPTFLYESIANLILFALLLLIHRLYTKRPDRFPYGLIFATYLGIYAVYRSVIEYYRIDSSYFLGVKVVYVIDGITIIAVLIIINYLVRKFKMKKIIEAEEKEEKEE